MYRVIEKGYSMTKSLGSVLSSYRKKNKISQIELARILSRYNIKVTSAAISAWEKNISIPNATQFLTLCKILGIKEIYNEFIEPSSDNAFLQLNSKGREKALEYINLLLLSEEYQKEDPAVIPFKRKIKWSLLSTSAGTGNFLDEENFELIEADDTVPVKADFGLKLHGDSMEPKYHHNQTIWVQQTSTLQNGEIGIFYLDGMTYCKQYKKDSHGINLISLNPKYSPINVSTDSTFQIFGRILN